MVFGFITILLAWLPESLMEKLIVPLQRTSALLSSIPMSADTLYNFANLLKDDDPERAVTLYLRSLSIEPSAASAWHNYGTALNSLTHYPDALLRH